jgi:hypothetical protein
MAYTYGTPASTTLSETVATSFERVFIQGADGAMKAQFKKYAQAETKTESYTTTLPTLASGTLSNGSITAYEYKESNTDQPRVTQTAMAWSTVPS